MKIVSPKLYLVSENVIDYNEIKNFLAAEGCTWRRTPEAKAPENVVEVAGRICYMSFSEKQSPRRNGQYIGNLITQGHESVLEHASWSFILAGVSRGFTHQLVRHRVGFSFSQLSQQYYDETDANAVLPNHYLSEGFNKKKWLAAIESALVVYREMASTFKSMVEGGKKERNRDTMNIARSVLPNAIESKIFVTANARAIRHFLSVRGDIAGDWEMREVSRQLYLALSERAPSLFIDFSLVRLSDGSFAVRKVSDKLDNNL